MKKVILTLIVLFSFVGFGMAQRVIKGTVMDDTPIQEGFIGAEVRIKGTIIGTVTDINGNFELSIPKKYNKKYNSDTLVFHFVGYINKEVSLLESQNEYFITLKEEPYQDPFWNYISSKKELRQWERKQKKREQEDKRKQKEKQ